MYSETGRIYPKDAKTVPGVFSVPALEIAKANIDLSKTCTYACVEKAGLRNNPVDHRGGRGVRMGTLFAKKAAGKAS